MLSPAQTQTQIDVSESLIQELNDGGVADDLSLRDLIEAMAASGRRLRQRRPGDDDPGARPDG